MPNSRLLSISVTAAMPSSAPSCKSYDEHDATFIAYLKINGLCKQKPYQICQAEVLRFEDDHSENINHAVTDFLEISGAVYNTFRYNTNADNPMLKYDVNDINTFFANFYDQGSESFKSDQIETQISLKAKPATDKK